jgi:tartronate-semialdehyde synthase
MNFEVQIWYDSLRAIQAEQVPMAMAAGGRGAVQVDRATPVVENEGRGFDFVKFAEACGAAGERVTDPQEIKAALKRGVESGVPYVIDIIMERETDCSMGASIDAIREFE